MLPPLAVVDEGHGLAREDVAGVDDAERGEDDPGIAIGVSGPEVVEVDLVGALPDRQAVFEGPLGPCRRCCAP